MKRSISAFLALASAASLAVVASASRPHYGGGLRVETAGVVHNLDPVAPGADAAESWTKGRITPLVFETLTAIDPDAGLQPALATTWETAGNSRWRFHIRRGVILHGGTTLEGWQVAASIRTGHPSWTVDADGDVVIVSPDRSSTDLPWELARAPNAIAVHSSSGDLFGTGPFRIERVDARRIVLRAHDRYWAARPFLDSIQIEMGRAPADQLASVDRNGADLVSARPTDANRLAQRGLRIASSRPIELVALVFEPHRATAAEAPIRSALADAIDRNTLCRILLQQHAEAARAALPAWLSGYELTGSHGPAGPRASIDALSAAQRTVAIRVDPADAMAQAIADRIVVDARERRSGLAVTVQTPSSGLAPRADGRLVRIPLEATTPDRALAGVMAALGARVTSLASSEPPPPAGAAVDVVYRVERALLEHQVIVPLVHLQDVYALGDRVHPWNGPVVLPSGALNLANVWIE